MRFGLGQHRSTLLAAGAMIGCCAAPLILLTLGFTGAAAAMLGLLRDAWIPALLALLGLGGLALIRRGRTRAMDAATPEQPEPASREQA